MDSETEVWRNIAYALFRRLVGHAAASQSVMLEKVEIDHASLVRGDWDTDDAGRVLVSFEKNPAGS